MTAIRIFDSVNIEIIEKAVNAFISINNLDLRIHSIKFHTLITHDEGHEQVTYFAMVVYN